MTALGKAFDEPASDLSGPSGDEDFHEQTPA
jgi:hypothetical protein